MIDTEYDDVDDAGYDTPEPEPEDTTSRSDVEEALISQKRDNGDPNPRQSDRGRLKGRADARSGGNFEWPTPYHDEASGQR